MGVSITMDFHLGIAGEMPIPPMTVFRALVYSHYRYNVGTPSQVGELLTILAQSPPVLELSKTHGFSSTVWTTSLRESRDGTPKKVRVVHDRVAFTGARTYGLTFDHVTLSDSQFELLSQLCENLHHLGKSHSRCTWVVSKDPAPKSWATLTPTGTLSSDYALLIPDPTYKGGVYKALSTQIEQVRKKLGGSFPGMRKCAYEMALNDAGPRHTPTAHTLGARPVAALLHLSTYTNNPRALPLVGQTLPLAEKYHRAVISTANRLGSNPYELFGMDEARRLMAGHEHAHILPYTTNGFTLDKILVYVPSGISPEGLSAITETTKLGRDFRIAVQDVFSNQEDLKRNTPFSRTSKVWESYTPFVPSDRYFKQVRATVGNECTRRGLPKPTLVEVLDHRDLNDFVTVRASQERFAHLRKRYSLRLHFAEPLTLPPLGANCHFGCGIFIPTSE